MDENEVRQRIKWTEMFYAGKRQATIDFAWWKDGVQYVGCGIKTLKQVLQEYDDAEKRDIEYLWDCAARKENNDGQSKLSYSTHQIYMKGL